MISHVKIIEIVVEIDGSGFGARLVAAARTRHHLPNLLRGGQGIGRDIDRHVERLAPEYHVDIDPVFNYRTRVANASN